MHHLHRNPNPPVNLAPSYIHILPLAHSSGLVTGSTIFKSPICPQKTLKSRLTKASQQLKELLLQTGCAQSQERLLDCLPQRNVHVNCDAIHTNRSLQMNGSCRITSHLESEPAIHRQDRNGGTAEKEREKKREAEKLLKQIP